MTSQKRTFIRMFCSLLGVICIFVFTYFFLFSSNKEFSVVEDTSPDLPETISIEIGGMYEKLKFEFVRIPPGSFKMGCDQSMLDNIPLLDDIDGYAKPSFRASITKGYYIGKDNITATQFAIFLNTLDLDTRKTYVNLEEDNKYLQYENEATVKIISKGNEPVSWPSEIRPVSTVSWLGAVTFCQWISVLTEMEFRLPTEAEWELAARGHGNKYDYVWETDGRFKPGTGPMTPNGIRGMATGYLGNWVSDYAGRFTSNTKIDPQGPDHAEETNDHILKRPMYSIASRSVNYSARKNNGIYGFRMVIGEDSVRQFIEHPELLSENVAIAVLVPSL